MSSSPTPLAQADLPFLDFEGARYATEPVRLLGELRAKSWLVNSNRGPQVLSHAVMSRMVLDPILDSAGDEYYRVQGGSDWIIEYATNAALPLIRAPRHDRIKKVLQRGFGLKRINEMRLVMRRVANRLLDRIEANGGQGDLVSDFSHHYPLEVLCELMGVPEKDIPRFGHWTVDLGYLASFPLKPHVPRIDAALSGLWTYFRELVEIRRAEPKDDFVSVLIQAQAEGEELSESELLGSLVNLLFAGHDTTRYQFGWVMQRMMAHREQWDMVIANPALAGNAIEETMRTEPSLTGFPRYVTKDVVYNDILIPAGSFLGLNAYAANHDPEVFPDPEKFDITRKNSNRQLTFGYGPHLCLGNGLARAEMTEALQIFTKRFPGLRLTGAPEFPEGQATNSAMRGAERLPLALGG